jgi:diaminopimelate epimerase
MRTWSFTKGHGTQNDFVLLLDPDDELDVGPAEVRFLCDRHAGIGGDGLLRAVRARHVPEWDGDGALWFMDYRNADGSVAEMCGNGVRVFATFLVEHGLVEHGPVEHGVVEDLVIPVATRGGLKEATMLPDGRVRVAMGPVTVGTGEETVTITTGDGQRHTARPADVGNPHAVSFVDELSHLPLEVAPVYPVQRFPDGVNLEFVTLRGPQHIAMRVHERGVGETRSCGTGTVAAAEVARLHVGDRSPLPVTYRVDVPGGSVEVELTDDQAYLTGPAVLVASGEVLVPEEG